MPNETLPYRPCVGIVLINDEGGIFVGERVDTPGAWQMPQGGIDEGETAEDAAYRELLEETGVPRELATVRAQTANWITYDLPDHLIGKVWGGKYRGQKQQWFLMHFIGHDEDFDLTVHHREFSRWKWTTPPQAIEEIVDFKRDLYNQIFHELLNVPALTEEHNA